MATNEVVAQWYPQRVTLQPWNRYISLEGLLSPPLHHQGQAVSLWVSVYTMFPFGPPLYYVSIYNWFLLLF